jgi:soluble lytic murein transglycosylase-like protein
MVLESKPKFSPLPADVAHLLDRAAAKHGIRRELARAVAWQESSGKQSAIGTSGERGVMQLMPGTARDLKVDPTNLEQNIEGGVRYLATLVKRFGERAGIACYNQGPAYGRKPESEWLAPSRRYADAVLSRARAEAEHLGGRAAQDPLAAAAKPAPPQPPPPPLAALRSPQSSRKGGGDDA